jgi:hypothetical protein
MASGGFAGGFLAAFGGFSGAWWLCNGFAMGSQPGVRPSVLLRLGGFVWQNMYFFRIRAGFPVRESGLRRNGGDVPVCDLHALTVCMAGVRGDFGFR